MTLTEEQKERMRKNRERALEIRRKRALEVAPSSSSEIPNKKVSPTSTDAQLAARTSQSLNKPSSDERQYCIPDHPSQKEVDDNNDSVLLEDFELNAPPTVTKKEAMSKYCLPEGTLAVCSFIEKDNPHRKGWNKMKLFHRSEIRRRSRERFGGLEGLIAEREKREQKRFERVLEETKDIFATKKKTT